LSHFTVRPPFMTKRTRSSSEMSCRGRLPPQMRSGPGRAGTGERGSPQASGSELRWRRQASLSAKSFLNSGNVEDTPGASRRRYPRGCIESIGYDKGVTGQLLTAPPRSRRSVPSVRSVVEGALAHTVEDEPC
jgi:hypothetical protein